MLQVAELEKESEPMKEKLQSDRRATEKYDEKVDEWKVRYVCSIHHKNQELKTPHGISVFDSHLHLFDSSQFCTCSCVARFYPLTFNPLLL